MFGRLEEGEVREAEGREGLARGQGDGVPSEEPGGLELAGGKEGGREGGREVDEGDEE
jgi:hypothetical protein